jgi:hypothetical protein
MGIKLSNNAFGTLAAGINSSATSITLTSGQGARFPTLSAGDYFYATLVDTSNNLEIVKCTARSTDVLTVVRAQESTTARAYNTGDRIEIRLTAQTFVDATAITPAAVSDQANTSTGYLTVPSGTTAQRPGSPVAGMIRYNTTLNQFEVYQNGAWTQYAYTYSVEYLIVAGGGAGGCGGGGAGGVLSGTYNAVATTSTSVIVGAGGTPTVSTRSGSNSTAIGLTAIGGGGGGGREAPAGSDGLSGGSGGGAGNNSVYLSSVGGSGTSGQGNAGGAGGVGVGGAAWPGAGGGGAGAAGSNVPTSSTNSNAGAGGNGTSSFSAWGAATSTGENVSGTRWYAGGGGGGVYRISSGGVGGNGGGGNGASSTGNDVPTGMETGTANTGGGGGGFHDAYGTAVVGANGGSGIVIFRYVGAQKGTGGTVSSSGGYTYHTFTTSGTFTP